MNELSRMQRHQSRKKAARTSQRLNQKKERQRNRDKQMKHRVDLNRHPPQVPWNKSTREAAQGMD